MGYKVTKNADPDKYRYSEYSIGLDAYSQLSLPSGKFAKNVVICGVDNSLSSMLIIEKKYKRRVG